MVPLSVRFAWGVGRETRSWRTEGEGGVGLGSPLPDVGVQCEGPVEEDRVCWEATGVSEGRGRAEWVGVGFPNGGTVHIMMVGVQGKVTGGMGITELMGITE